MSGDAPAAGDRLSSGLRIGHFRRAFGAPSETFISDPILRLLSRGIDNQLFTLLSLDMQSSIPQVAMSTAKPRAARGIEQRTRRLPTVLSKADLLAWPFARHWLRQRIKSADRDVLVSHFGPDACLAAPVARRLRIPHLAFFYGYDITMLVRSERSIWRRLYRQLFRSADALCTTSRYLAGRLEALGAPASKISVIHAGVDVSLFSYSDPSKRFDGRVVRLLHVGRLTAKKSPVKLLRAVSEARALCPQLDFRLTIAGDGEMAGDAQAEAGQLGLASNVQFMGRVNRDRVRTLLSTHHLYTQYCETTSAGETEGLGVSFIEASASGLPIVTTRHNGLPEVVLDGVSGVLSEEGDVSGMARNIALLAQASSTWGTLGGAGCQHVARTFSLSAQADMILKECARLVSQRRSRT